MQSSHSSLSSRKELEKRLAFHLGVEDGTGDVLDYLLTMESKEELLDYLLQFLGYDKRESINMFIADMEKFRRDEPLSNLEATAIQLATDAPSVKPPPQQQRPAATILSEKSQKQQDTTPNSRQSSSYASMAKQKNVAGRNSLGRGNLGGVGGRGANRTMADRISSAKTATVIPPTKPSSRAGNMTTLKSSKPGKPGTKQPPAALSTSTAAKQNVEQLAVAKNPNKEPRTKRIGPPPQGTASVVCGCFGTRHAALTNCLQCGRISCEREGYDFCPFCGFLVEEPNSSEFQDDPAWQLKEQLLQSEREHAKRTVILDDQADYFSNQTSAWLNEGEQDKARQEEEKRIQNLHHRKKQQLDVAF